MIGTISFVLCIITVILGAMFKGRIGSAKGHIELDKIHKYSGIITGISVVFTFIFMILPPYFTGETIVLDFHGWNATFALIIVLIQVSLSLVIKDRRKIRKSHSYLGYILLILLSMQIVSGLILVSIG
jgi:hypothetical protein